MASLGSAWLELRVKAGELKKGLAGAKKDTQAFGEAGEKQAGRVRKGFEGLRTKIADTTKGIPLIGGAVSKMVTAMSGPVGLAVGLIAGIGLAAVGVVGKVNQIQGEIAILRNEVGLSAEAAQGWVNVAKQFGTDGDTITDIFREMGIRLGELATLGSGPAKDALAAINVPLSDLQGLSPEEQFAKLHQEIGKIEDPARRAFIAEELFGGAVETASGLINAQTGELLAQVDAFAANNAISGDTIDAQKDLKTLWADLKQVLGPVTKELAEALIPALRDFLAAVIPLKPFITTFISVALLPLKQGFNFITSTLNIVSALLRGDFTGALTHARDFFINTADLILGAAEKVIGIFNKDMAASIRGVRDQLKTIKTDAEKDMPATAGAVEDASGKIVTSSGQAGDAITGIGTATADAKAVVSENSRLMAQAQAESSQAMIKSSETRVKNLLADYAEEMKAQGERLRAEEKFRADMAAAAKAYRDREHKENLAHYDASETEYRMALNTVEKMTVEQRAELLAGQEDASDRELALQIIANRRYADEQASADADALQAKKDADAEKKAAAGEHYRDALTHLETHIDSLKTRLETASGAEKTALTTQLAELETERATAQTTLLSNMDTRIGEVKTRLETASGAEKTALTTQLAALETERATAHSAQLLAKQAEIDALTLKMATAQGAELLALQAHRSALQSEYSLLASNINAELDAIQTPKIVEVVTEYSTRGRPVARVGGGTGGQGNVDADGNPIFRTMDGDGDTTRVENSDGTITQTTVFDDGRTEVTTTNPDGSSQTHQTDPDGTERTHNYRARDDDDDGAQHGALIRGVSNPFGRRIRVGENNTDEMILPLPPGLLDALRRGNFAGGGRGTGREREHRVVVKIGEQEVADIIVGGRSTAERQSRWK